eukprot:CAMPEP_0202972258 /NCGR_PEP_ID=MMETSP1396-20130829/34818_1 /ASSEMBLY_ACC=CAM_ASM_000872 /TAXON_ID= /ORGANISM="Pseudokeronopsis sp., Strain Brazil" /LENGTH=70 /DNA_ID=CAMNT_0049702475 /DNA_START=50 /DNA_END=262 /DNA_ORIENTATION=+
MIQYLDQLAANPSQIDIDLWCSYQVEILNLCKGLGSAISAAFSDIDKKAQHIKNNKELYKQNFGEEVTVI